MLRHNIVAVVCAAAILLLAGLSPGCGSVEPVTPENNGSDLSSMTAPDVSGSGRILWGLWDVSIRKSTRDIEVVPVRGAAFHLNAVDFLEPPALTDLTFDVGTLIIDVPSNYVGVDVILTHPFPGLNRYSGFDVRGIVFLPGSDIPFTDKSLIFPGPGEGYLINADGHTRWWNPKEFPNTGIFGFHPGMFGNQGGAGYFTATVNGYKYFADGLGLSSDVIDVPADGRGVFQAGSTNRRHYQISFGDDPDDFLKFQYAVDASWQGPQNPQNPVVPDDFPLTANAPEGYAIEVEVVENTLWWLEGIGTGGILRLSIDVYTWHPDAIESVKFDSPDIIETPITASVVPGSGGGPNDPVYSTYQVDIIPDALTSDGYKDYLITVETNETYAQAGLSLFFGPIASKVSAFKRETTNVSYVPPLQWSLKNAGLLSVPPFTVGADFSVVGSGAYQGVYFFNNDYELFRYDLDYAQASHVSTMSGFFGYSTIDLYGAPETVGRFEVSQFGQYVSSTYSAAPSPTFLGGLKRDYAFFFNEVYSNSGQVPMQIGIPDPSKGYFRFIDACANWSSTVQDAKIYWIQADDPLEGTIPADGITVILGVYQYGFSGNPFSNDITYLSASVVPAGVGNGYVDITCLERFAVDSDPQGVTGSTDLICWFMETTPPAIECFSVVSSDDSGDLNQHLTTLDVFHGTPRDIALLPANKGGYYTYNWLVVLEEGNAEWSVETFDQHGNPMPALLGVPGYPANIDVDPINYEIHVWFSMEIGGPLYFAVYGLVLG